MGTLIEGLTRNIQEGNTRVPVPELYEFDISDPSTFRRITTTNRQSPVYSTNDWYPSTTGTFYNQPELTNLLSGYPRDNIHNNNNFNGFPEEVPKEFVQVSQEIPSTSFQGFRQLGQNKFLGIQPTFVAPFLATTKDSSNLTTAIKLITPSVSLVDNNTTVTNSLKRQNTTTHVEDKKPAAENKLSSSLLDNNITTINTTNSLNSTIPGEGKTPEEETKNNNLDPQFPDDMNSGADTSSLCPTSLGQCVSSCSLGIDIQQETYRICLNECLESCN